MDTDRNEMTKRIFHLTLEILHLLTGEDYTIVKKTSGECVAPSSHLQESGGRSRARGPIMEPPPHSPIHDQKILELIHRITELLTREVPIRCQDVAVYFSMEEWEYVEGHKDQYKDQVMMEDQQPLTSPDGVMDRNPPERCPRPLYSQDCPEGNVPEKHQGGDLTNNKVEDEEERMRGHHPCMREVKEEIPGGVTPENPTRNFGENFILSPNYKVEDEDMMERSSDDGALLTPYVHPGLHSTDLSYNNPPDHEEPSPDQSHIGFYYDASGRDFINSSSVGHRESLTGKKLHVCSECGKCFIEKSKLVRHERSHTGEKPYSCSHCGKCFIEKSGLVRHEKSHTGEKPYSCSECGKCFKLKSYLASHARSHTGEKPYSCSECGKCFANKSHLVTHKRSHTGEKPYSCSKCGKCFASKSNHVKHERNHTGENPFSCLECGKCFASKSHLVIHERSHTGEKPFSCSECGKRFSNKPNLVIHERSHTGEKPFSCFECGKSFASRSNLGIHERIHTGENPYSCSECGKCFTSRSNLVTHERCHTGEKPYSCTECGKCFTSKSNLLKHKRCHTGETLY
ncbi:oocyte zinc finger protein XlCOF7.1-like isoform X2 [Hyla sarda]|uniref:oocyte zinc finger protein XlCOF7.1-like isoform X2 n=1 Tax=Hyla sarda TaxID=327740 RepID=UPI0024C36C9A|nr:oocyte zinc finger protein XlCOF7.1-like isoform X2 [Hyla sarda]